LFPQAFLIGVAAFCGAGVSPAVLCCGEDTKTAGETPAPPVSPREWHNLYFGLAGGSITKIFFCCASHFRFAILELILDFRRAHS